jgi:hypothetical protein
MKRGVLRLILTSCLVVLLGASVSWASPMVHVKAAASGPTVETTSTSWTDIPNLRMFFIAEDAGNACISMSGEFFASGGRMFIRAMIDGAATAPTDVTTNEGFGGTYSFNFTVNVTAGIHEATIQWSVDGGATGSVGDRTMWVTTAPEVVNTVAVPSGPEVTTTNTDFEDIPNLGLNIQVPEEGDVFVTLTAEADTSAADKRMFVRAMIDAETASPSDVVLAQTSDPSLSIRSFTFVKHLTAGIHPLQMQWHTDSGGTAYMGDRTITIGFGKPSELSVGHGGVVSVSAPSGPDVTTTSTSFTDIPDMTASIGAPEGASLVALLTAEANTSGSERMFVRALVDGQAAQPSDVVFSVGSFVGTRSMAFVIKNLASGPHQVTMQWKIDSGGTAYMGDRNLTLIALPTSNHYATGWWYNPLEEGTGVSVEVQGDRLFLAWYTFNPTGEPIWHTAGGAMTDSSHFSGSLMQWTGWPLGSGYVPPTASSVGTVGITFLSENTAELSWTVAGSSGTKNLQKFMDDFSPGDEHPKKVNGWWYDPSFNGMGFFFEAQGGNMFTAWYHYRDGGGPRWWSSGGAFADVSSIYSGSYDEWINGQCIGCTYTAPVISSNPSTVNVDFLGGSQATLVWSGGTLNLQRFSFDNL